MKNIDKNLGNKIEDLLEDLTKNQQKYSKEYSEFSNAEKEKFHRVDNAIGGLLEGFSGIKSNRDYGDLPKKTVVDAFLKSDLKNKLKETLNDSFFKVSLKDFTKIADTPEFKDYEKGFKEFNKQYREMTKACVSNEDLVMAIQIKEKLQDKFKQGFNQGISSLDNIETFANKSKELMDETVSDVPGGKEFLDKINKMGFSESLSQKMNKGLDKMIEFCDNPIDDMALKNTSKKNKLY